MKDNEHDNGGGGIVHGELRTKTTPKSHFTEFVWLWGWESWSYETTMEEIDVMGVMCVGGVELVDPKKREQRVTDRLLHLWRGGLASDSV